MADTYLAISAINKLFQSLTINVLSLPFETDEEKQAAYNAVRISWPTYGQPAWGVTDDVVVIRCVEVDNQYNRQRDIEITPTEDITKVEEATSYTRVWRIQWVLYGPNGFDNARKIKSALFHQDIHDLLALSNLFMILDILAPVRLPELYNEQWFERCDLNIQFNEFVKERVEIGTVKSTEISIYTDDGLQENFTVEVIED